ncbi:MAG: sulfatase-like hydrolase/transferase [Armatimonadota bacterium]|nr:MAG: sulfatase-like hydrolase/transferase [Armatimonadota bacterium]
MGARPNILYLMTDQQTARAMSCSGNPYISTPGMDRIAAAGVRFALAYATQPLCLPNRTCMFTGRLPHETGATINNPATPNRVDDGPHLGRLLADAGYDCGYFGKWHIASSSEDRAKHGFREIWASSAKSLDLDPTVTAKCLDFALQERESPFFAVASYMNPHNICQWARGGDQLLTELPNCRIPPVPTPGDCPPLPDNFAIPDGEPERLRWVHDQGPAADRLYPTAGWSEGLWRQYLWAYYRITESVDRSIKCLVDGLEAAGLLEDTLIVFTSDHGEGCAEHHWNQKQTLYESVIHVPFIIADPTASSPGRLDDQTLVNNGLDLMPTICDYAGISPPEGCRGISLRSAVTNPEAPAERDFIVLETTFAQGAEKLDLCGRCLRTLRYKYIVYDRGRRREQLFDMANDPGEMSNLAACEEHQHILNRHRELIAGWCRDTEDSFPLILRD